MGGGGHFWGIFLVFLRGSKANPCDTQVPLAPAPLNSELTSLNFIEVKWNLGSGGTFFGGGLYMFLKGGGVAVPSLGCFGGFYAGKMGFWLLFECDNLVLGDTCFGS